MKTKIFTVLLAMAFLVSASVALAAPKQKGNQQQTEQGAPQGDGFNWEGEAAKQPQGYSAKGLAAVGQGSTKVTVTVEGGKAKVNFANIYGNPAMRGFFTPDQWIRGTTLVPFAGGPDAAGNARLPDVTIVDNNATVVIDNPADAVKANPAEYGLKPGQPFFVREHFWAMVVGGGCKGSIILDPNDPAIVYYMRDGKANLDTLVVQADFYSDGSVKVGKATGAKGVQGVFAVK